MTYAVNRPGTNVVLVIFAALLLLPGAIALAQTPPPLPPEQAFRMEIASDPDGGTRLIWEIEEGYYLYRDYLAAETEAGVPVTLSTGPGIAKDDPTFGTTEVYYERAEAVLPAVAGPVTITYQGCQDGGLCYPPIRETIEPALYTLNEATATPAPAAAGGEAPLSPGALSLDSGGGGLVGGLVERGGALLVLAGFLGFGLLLAFTPCVFPMFPIVAGMLARQGEALTARRGAALTSTYVLAMASAFGLLGMVAAWSGQNLQMALQSPLALGIVAAIFVVLALSMFGLFELKLPDALTARLARIGSGQRGSLGGAAALGFTSALIIGPCVTAPLAGALLYIAQTGDVALGAGALFALGLGQGLPLLVVGTVGAQMLPRAGAWMEAVKHVFGLIFLGMAVWLVGRLVPGPVELALWSGLLIATGVFLGAFDNLAPETGTGRRALKAAGVIATFGGALLGLGAASGGDDPLRPLAGLHAPAAAEAEALEFASVDSLAGLQARLAVANPALVYVTADWCVTCRTIERRVLPDPQTQEALAGLTLIKADLTDFDAEGQELLRQLDAVGPPTMIFLDASRAEPEGTRLVGTVTTQDIVRSARELR